jgi:hypothetical protein
MWVVSWESNPARAKASERGAKCYPRGEFPVQILKIFRPHTNIGNSIQWTSGLTGLLQWDSHGFDTDKCPKALFH